MQERAAQLSIVQKYEKDPRVGKSYRYEFWHVQGTDLDGRRIRRKFSDRQKALDWKNLKEIELTNRGRKLHSIITDLSDEQIKEAQACFLRLGDRYTLTQAIDYFFGHYQKPDFKISLSEATVKFRGALEGQVRERTLMQLKSTLGQFERFMGNCDLHEITHDDVERYLCSLRAKDGVNQASRKTWNNYRADLHLFFEWCTDKQRRWLSANPAADVTRFKIDREHIEVLPVKKARDLMKFVSEFKGGKLARYFALALFAGIRPGGEMLKLAREPKAIDLDNGVIRVSAAMAKTRKPRQVTIQANLRKWLSAFSGEVIPPNSDRELKTVRKEFGLTHDVLRHTFISMHVAKFKSFAGTAVESGNSEKIIRDHYFNAASFKEANAFWRICPGKRSIS